MTRFCKAASWFCNCLAVALLIVGILAVPEKARADGGLTCADYCVGAPDFNACMQQCQLAGLYPCGGWNTTDTCCAGCETQGPTCSGTNAGCGAWTTGCDQCKCLATGIAAHPCGCY
ncbi:MAG: hypothetical protein HYS12_11705 [Planctomycetes bacterium]|nr:hypothetical protein [Planctomycetota bacterium]